MPFEIRSSSGAKPPLWIERGGTLRWRVHSAERDRFSSSWTIWTTKNSPDAYVAQRRLGDQLKISLHQSGEFHTSFINNERSIAWQGTIEGGSRHLDEWQRPPQFVDGWTRLVEVVFPESELRAFEESDLAEKNYIGLPIGSDHALFIYVLEARVDTPIAMTFADSFHVATMVLDEERRIVVMAVAQAWGEGTLIQRARNSEIEGKPPNLARPGTALNPHSPSVRFMLHGRHEGGVRWMIDAAGAPS